MAQSPYLSKEMKEYLIKNQIEEKLNKAVNEMLRQKPEDPYGTLVNLLGEECSQKIVLAKVKALEVLNNEFRPTIKLDGSFRYKMAIKDGFHQIYPIVDEAHAQLLYDQESNERFEGKGMLKACELINNKAFERLDGIDCNDAKKIDDAIVSLLEQTNGVGINVSLSLSILVQKAIASLLAIPLYKKLNANFLSTENFQPRIPPLFLCILQGSKVHGSKCKPARFYYILPEEKSALEKTILGRNLSLGVRKVIASGKQGESAVRQLSDGSFVCPYDTINDNLKMLDEVINQNGAKDQVRIGIEWAAENFYQVTQAKYELENPNPKNFLDTNQLIDYYLKLCAERPSIAYMEDPIFPDQYDAWIALKNKFQGKNVKFGSRRLYNSLENAKKSIEIVKAEDSGLTEEQVAQANAKKVHLDYAVIKYGEFLTLSSVYQLGTFLTTRSPNLQLLIQDNASETEDTFIVDLAISIPKSALLLGPPLKPERLAKFNKFIEVEQILNR